MSFRISRRDFFVGISAMTAAAVASGIPAYAEPEPLLYPPVDLSYFDKPISAAPSSTRIGYASITWDGNDRQAIQDIADLGFPGIQLRANAIKEFASPTELRDLLQQHHLTMVALSSGGVSIDPVREAEDLATHTANAKFVHDVGGSYLQVTDQRPKDRPLTAADYKRLGRLITEIGKRTADLGVSLGYHNHMGSMSERPEALDQILQAADPRYAKLELDVAHYFQGGGDPVKAIRQYKDQLLFLHIKDVEQTPSSSPDAKQSYRFVELGQGKVDIPAVFKALHEVKFRGWAIIELDRVTDKSRSPKESAIISKKYLEERLAITV